MSEDKKAIVAVRKRNAPTPTALRLREEIARLAVLDQWVSDLKKCAAIFKRSLRDSCKKKKTDESDGTCQVNCRNAVDLFLNVFASYIWTQCSRGDIDGKSENYLVNKMHVCNLKDIKSDNHKKVKSNPPEREKSTSVKVHKPCIVPLNSSPNPRMVNKLQTLKRSLDDAIFAFIDLSFGSPPTREAKNSQFLSCRKNRILEPIEASFTAGVLSNMKIAAKVTKRNKYRHLNMDGELVKLSRKSVSLSIKVKKRISDLTCIESEISESDDLQFVSMLISLMPLVAVLVSIQSLEEKNESQKDESQKDESLKKENPNPFTDYSHIAPPLSAFFDSVNTQLKSLDVALESVKSVKASKQAKEAGRHFRDFRELCCPRVTQLTSQILESNNSTMTRFAGCLWSWVALFSEARVLLDMSRLVAGSVGDEEEEEEEGIYSESTNSDLDLDNLPLHDSEDLGDSSIVTTGEGPSLESIEKLKNNIGESNYESESDVEVGMGDIMDLMLPDESALSAKLRRDSLRKKSRLQQENSRFLSLYVSRTQDLKMLKSAIVLTLNKYDGIVSNEKQANQEISSQTCLLALQKQVFVLEILDILFIGLKSELALKIHDPKVERAAKTFSSQLCCDIEILTSRLLKFSENAKRDLDKKLEVDVGLTEMLKGIMDRLLTITDTGRQHKTKKNVNDEKSLGSISASLFHLALVSFYRTSMGGKSPPYTHLPYVVESYEGLEDDLSKHLQTDALSAVLRNWTLSSHARYCLHFLTRISHIDPGLFLFVPMAVFVSQAKSSFVRRECLVISSEILSSLALKFVKDGSRVAAELCLSPKRFSRYASWCLAKLKKTCSLDPTLIQIIDSLDTKSKKSELAISAINLILCQQIYLISQSLELLTKSQKDSNVAPAFSSTRQMSMYQVRIVAALRTCLKSVVSLNKSQGSPSQQQIISILDTADSSKKLTSIPDKKVRSCIGSLSIYLNSVKNEMMSAD